ncbi:MAG TPA: protein kinase [Vineibacter sp.]|nr:protein kinase [Vineibacter sp.]
MSDNRDSTVVRPPGGPATPDPEPLFPPEPGGSPEFAPDEGARTRVVTAETPDAPTPGWTAASPSQVAGGAPSGGPLTAGVVLGSTFQIEELIARGGMGEVYRARHRITGDPIAIKTIRPELAGDQKIAELFKREAQALRNIRHPAIVSYEGVFDDGTGQLYIAMEFVDGPSISRLIQNGPLPPADIRRLRDRVADGLAAAHAQGVIHRDLSPDNVILPGGRIEAAKLIDFGIAKQTDSSKATVIGNDFAGKYSYAAPEQLGLQGAEVGPRADIYSLGLVLAAAAAGAPLNMGNSLPSAVHARMKVPDLSRVPAELRGELGAMLQPDPAQRPQRMADLVSPAGRGHRTAVAEGTSARRGAGPMIGGIAAALLILLGGGGYLLKDRLFGPSPDPPDKPGSTVSVPGTSSPGTSGPTASTSGGITPAGPSPPVGTPPSTTSPGGSTGITPAGPTPSPPGGTTTPPSDGTGPTASATTPVPPQPDSARIRGQLDELVRQFTCAALAPQVDPDLTVRFGGSVASTADRARLLTAARQIDGVRRVDTDVDVRLLLDCELARAVGGATAANFRLQLNKADEPYKVSKDPQKGERVMFRVVPPPERQGYLNVVFLQSDDTVSHPEPWSKLPVAAGQTREFGRANAERITFAPPAGKMAIVAVLSRQPLLSKAREDELKKLDWEERTEKYLAALKQALARQPDSLVSYVVFDTVE